MAKRKGEMSFEMASRIYDLLANCDRGDDPLKMDQSALERAVHEEFVKADRFRKIKDMRGNVHQAVSRYAVTDKGREFIDRVEELAERSGTPWD